MGVLRTRADTSPSPGSITPYQRSGVRGSTRGALSAQYAQTVTDPSNPTDSKTAAVTGKRILRDSFHSSFDTNATNYHAAVLADTPIANWRLQESGTPTTWADSSGNGRAMAVDNGGSVLTGLPGPFPGTKAVSITSAGGIGHIADAAVFDTTAWSIEYWIRQSLDFYGYAYHILSKWSSTADATYAFYVFGNYQGTTPDGGYTLGCYANVAGGWNSATGNGTPSRGEWNHVVATFDPVLGGKLYIDGVLVATGPTGALAQNTQSVVMEAAFGFEQSELALYNYALNAARVAAHYSAAGGTDSQTRLVTGSRPMTDAENLTDSRVQTSAIKRTQTDNEPLTDTRTQIQGWIRSLTDPENPTDSRVQTQGWIRSILDPENLTDTRSQVSAIKRTQTDNEPLTDTSSTRQGWIRALTDPEGLTDTRSQTSAAARASTDPANPTDSKTTLYGWLRSITDAENLTDTRAQTLAGQRTQTDNEGLTDIRSWISSTFRAVTDPTNPTDSRVQVATTKRAQTDSEGLTDVAGRVAAYAQTMLLEMAFGYRNLLTANEASMETDVTGWTTDTHATLSQAVVGFDGTHALAVTAAT